MKKKAIVFVVLVALMMTTALPLFADNKSYVHFHIIPQNICNKTVVAVYDGSAVDIRVANVKYDNRFYTQGPYVCLLQDLLRECKKRNIGKYPGGIDGYFGNTTKQGVIDYQRARGLYPDGIVGPDTWKALEKDYKNMGSPQLWAYAYPKGWGW